MAVISPAFTVPLTYFSQYDGVMELPVRVEV